MWEREAGEFEQPRMASTQQAQDRIATFARTLAEAFFQVGDSNVRR